MMMQVGGQRAGGKECGRQQEMFGRSGQWAAGCGRQIKRQPAVRGRGEEGGVGAAHGGGEGGGQAHRGGGIGAVGQAVGTNLLLLPPLRPPILKPHLQEEVKFLKQCCQGDEISKADFKIGT
jgi:hypothetical protein